MWLTALYDASWRAEAMPKQWSESMISYLYKGRDSKTEISSYTPVLLMSVIGKTFTKAWLPRLGKVVGPALVEEQGWARTGKGAMEHLWACMATFSSLSPSPNNRLSA